MQFYTVFQTCVALFEIHIIRRVVEWHRLGCVHAIDLIDAEILSD